MIEVRNEKRTDFEAVARVEAAAFGRAAEATLVEELREIASPLISLVATQASEVVGHILFSPVRIGAHELDPCPLALAPLAVQPEHQRTGIGSRLVHAGLDACRRLGTPFVIVVGIPAYYPRFGFSSASAHGLRAEQTEDASFMVRELVAGSLAGVSGLVQYLPPFSKVP